MGLRDEFIPHRPERAGWPSCGHYYQTKSLDHPLRRYGDFLRTLDERTRNCLLRANIDSWERLEVLERDDLLAITHLGITSLDVIIDKLGAFGVNADQFTN